MGELCIHLLLLVLLLLLVVAESLPKLSKPALIEQYASFDCPCWQHLRLVFACLYMFKLALSEEHALHQSPCQEYLRLHCY